MSKTILKIDASARKAGSATRDLTEKLVNGLAAKIAGAKTVTRDVAAGFPLVDEEWIGANFTDPAARTDAQKAKLALSDSLVAELKAADVIVIAAPVYNFGIPAALKSWIDLVARARETFQYTEAGPEGLLKGKKAYIVAASGGTPVGSSYDYATTYLRHVFGFLGISDVEVVAADKLAMDAEGSIKAANEAIDALVAKAA
ncbi:NAD(P)H-dependent oxidoreductase [Pannonibacter sp. Pt2-lr]|uniref:FMN dependent NADH:quinone oxidoreductase n=1 Tax=Pannonibacter anstelovis TaxID=3121537 RepID=A0ABU7ZSY5_9HYPH